MEFSSATYAAFAVVFLSCYYLLLLRPKSGRHRTPPKAGGARLFTGHLHLMEGSSPDKLPHVYLGSLADQYGPIFTIRLGVRRALVVSSWELAKELFTTHDLAVTSRPRIRASEYLSYDQAMVGFAPYGPYWREIRKLIAAELLSNRRIELQKDVRVSETELLIKELYGLWEKEKDGSGRVLVDMKQWFGNLNLNVVLRMVAGKRFYGGDNAEETEWCREVMREFFHLVGLFVPGDAFPFLGWLDLGGFEKRMKQTAIELDKIVSKWLAEHREKEHSGDDKPQDFMDVMLSTLQAANLQGSYDADTIIKATCQIMISGATDSTTVVLIWTLSLLLNNRDVLRKVQKELDEQVGRKRRVEESDIANLVYLQAVVKETLRLYPAAPLGGTRAFTQDCNVGGYHIQKGTWLIMNLWKLHRDPQVWPDHPSEFRPQRFLDKHKNIDVKGQDFILMPFGGGRRICPGANFGLHMVHLVLANLLHAFDLSTVSDEQVDMTGSAGLTNLKVTPLDVLIAPRLWDTCSKAN